MHKPSVLLVHNYYKFSGGEDIVFDIEKSLLRQHNHIVFEYTVKNDRIDSLGKFNAALQTIWSQPSYQAVKKIIQDTKPDIAHFHNTFLLVSPAAYYACAEMHVPAVQTLHNYRLICPNAYLFRNGSVCEECVKRAFPMPGIRYACYRNSHRQTAVVAAMLGFHKMIHTWQNKVDRFIALTEFAREKFILGGLPAEKIAVKPNFVAEAKKPAPTASNSYVLYIGHLSPEKGIEGLLSAWDSLEIPLKIIGDGPLADTVKMAVEKSAFIEYLGSLSHSSVMECLSQAAFLVFPSRLYEGFGMIIIEAFAAGIPVIASNVGSRSEIIQDGSTGLLYIPEDASDLASKVRWLWNHPEERMVMGKKARLEYERKYTPEKNYQMLTDIYEQLL